MGLLGELIDLDDKVIVVIGAGSGIGQAAFLASRASDHVNGHVLAVDGGYLAR